MITQFFGDLNTNEFYNAIYNQLRLAQISADNLEGLDDTLANTSDAAPTSGLKLLSSTA